MEPNVILIRKKTEAKILLQCTDSGILREVSEHFTFFAEGYKFHPMFKNKIWDGKIRLFNLRDGTLPFGLFSHLYEFAEARGYKVEFSSEFDEIVYPKKEEIVSYVSSLKVTTRCKEIQPHSYQVEAIAQGLSQGRNILISPTGSGKSLIIYFMMRWFLQNQPDKILIVVPTTSLVEQMYKDFDDYSSLDEDFSSADDVHRIYSGKEKNAFSQRVVVTTWQSAITLPPGWFSQFGMVIGDEAHLFKAKSLTTIMDRLIHARFRIGTTGTLDGSQIHEWVLNGVFGATYKVISTKELMDSDILSQCKIECLVLKHNEEDRRLVSKLDYADEIDFIVSCESRNNLIVNLALAQTGNTLVLFHRVEKHGIPLFKSIQKKSETSRKVFYVSGTVDAEEREKIREITEGEKNAIIVASMGVFSTGVNIRNLHTIIFASPTKSQIKVLQSIGRGLRKSDDGRATTIYDIGDDLSWKKSKNYTLDHAISRVKIYSKEKFQFKIHEVPLP